MSKIDPIVKETYMEKTMNEYKQEALRKISAIVVHQGVVQDLSTMIANAWFDSQADAERLADKLDLGKLDFLAIIGDVQSFEEALLEERDRLMEYYG